MDKKEYMKIITLVQRMCDRCQSECMGTCMHRLQDNMCGEKRELVEYLSRVLHRKPK